MDSAIAAVRIFHFWRAIIMESNEENAVWQEIDAKELVRGNNTIAWGFIEVYNTET